jgi:hypothetical protein
MFTTTKLCIAMSNPTAYWYTMGHVAVDGLDRRDGTLQGRFATATKDWKMGSVIVPIYAAPEMFIDDL